MHQPSENTALAVLRSLYPQWSEEDLLLADECFTDYLALAVEIYKDVANDPKRYVRFKALTAGGETPTMGESVAT